MNLLLPIVTLVGLGFLFSLGLVFSYKKLRIYQNPKIEEICETLPQGNCGACGYSGCRAFAEAVVNGEAELDGCPVCGEDIATKIAKILGIEARVSENRVARVHCRGTPRAQKSRGIYQGIQSCMAAHLIGGTTQCSWGCLGFGDCVRSCPFNAIAMSEDNLPVISEEKCTACGICVNVCPRNIIELRPVSEKVLVFCRSEDRGPSSIKVCQNACIACGICARACPEGIILQNNLAKIVDHKKITPEVVLELKKCPTGAIGCINHRNRKYEFPSSSKGRTRNVPS